MSIDYESSVGCPRLDEGNYNLEIQLAAGNDEARNYSIEINIEPDKPGKKKSVIGGQVRIHELRLIRPAKRPPKVL